MKIRVEKFEIEVPEFVESIVHTLLTARQQDLTRDKDNEDRSVSILSGMIPILVDLLKPKPVKSVQDLINDLPPASRRDVLGCQRCGIHKSPYRSDQGVKLDTEGKYAWTGVCLWCERNISPHKRPVVGTPEYMRGPQVEHDDFSDPATDPTKS